MQNHEGVLPVGKEAERNVRTVKTRLVPADG